ncbi:MAG TPA: HXXEE domain-containing protein [Thermoanaerobaculia bacterium]|nr:HXXEE domain-containing protein [Thermoanaerobaculia bacterium]
MAGPRKSTSEWTLWVVAASCALHPMEEYFTGWQGWALETLGIVMPTARFVTMNAVLFVAALFLARVGWRRPEISLVIPAATLVNAVFFHILPTIVQHRVSPGVYTATLLYLPFSSWAYLGAWRDGVPRRALAVAFMGGTFLMVGVVLAARWTGGLNRVG